MADGAIYLDYNATAPLDPRVLQVMLPWLSGFAGNAASQHVHGRAAAQAVEVARGQVASLLHCAANEVIFTSGATEANNLALKGALENAPAGRCRLIVAATEHKSVLDAAAWLENRGTKVEVVPVRRDGLIDLHALTDLMGPDVALVSVMLANNETGVLNPIAAVSEIAGSAGALTHTDATQAFGKVPVDVRALGVHLASVSSHKIYGPQGVGALYLKRGTPLAPTMHGGGHERGLRSGTLNVAGIVGLGAAAAVGAQCMDADADRLRRLRDQLHSLLGASFPGLQPVAIDPTTGFEAPTLPNTLNVRFPGLDAETIMAGAPGVAVSAGSACTSLVPSPSHVLMAMLGDHQAASECLRFSVGRPTTETQIIEAAAQIGRAARRVREMTGTGTAWCGP